MSFLGTIKRSEEIPISLTLDATPTGTPQYRILDSSRTQTAALANLSGSGLNWYKTGATVPASGQGSAVGSFLIEYIAVIDGVSRPAYDSFEVSVFEIDDVKAQTATIETNTDTIIANIGAATGAFSIVINVKDVASDPVEGVNVSIHNSSNDDSPRFGTNTTNTLGNTDTINLDAATYTVRLSKNGAIVSENETIVVAASGTKNLTVAALTITPPADAGLCKLFFFPQTISQVDVTDAVVRVKTSTDLALVGGVYVDNRESLMVADTTTDPDNYYINAKIGSTVRIIGPIFGFNHEIIVPSQSTLDLSTLITS